MFLLRENNYLDSLNFLNSWFYTRFFKSNIKTLWYENSYISRRLPSSLLTSLLVFKPLNIKYITWHCFKRQNSQPFYLIRENYTLSLRVKILECQAKSRGFQHRNTGVLQSLHVPTYLLVSPLHDKIGTSVDRDANEWKVRPGNT